MRVGLMNKRLTLQVPATERNAVGEEVTTWVDYATVWASIEPLSGKEILNIQGIQAEVTTRIKIRYIAQLTPKWRISFEDGDRIFEIKSVINRREQNWDLELMCLELP